MTGRNRKWGANIPEFTLCLVFLIFATFPILNLVGFLAASTALKFVVQDITNLISHAQSREDAGKRSEVLVDKLKNPVFTGFHKVEILEIKKPFLKIELMESSGKSTLIDLNKPVPEKFKDKEGGLKPGTIASFHLEVPCLIHPLINLSGIPLVGQTKMIGSPTRIDMCSTSHIEYRGILEQMKEQAQIKQ